MADENVLDENEILPTEPIQYTKSGRVKKERTEAQKAAFIKAREAYAKKHVETMALRKETQIAAAQTKIKAQTDRVEKIKAKMPKKEEPKTEESSQSVTLEPKEEPKESLPPPLIRQKAKKKPVVIIEQNSDSESGEDQDNVIFIKRRTKKEVVKEAVKQLPTVHNPFATGYRFYDRNAMS